MAGLMSKFVVDEFLFATAGSGRNDAAILAKNEHGGDAGNTIFHRGIRPFSRISLGPVQFFGGNEIHYLLAVLLRGLRSGGSITTHANDKDILVLIFFLKLFDVRQRGDAWSAPGGPEVQ